MYAKVHRPYNHPGLNHAQIDLILTQYLNCSSQAGKGRDISWPGAERSQSQHTLAQLTNHSTFHISEGGPSFDTGTIQAFMPDWGERCCNNVKYVKNNVFFEQPSIRVCSSTPPKQNPDLVKVYNRTPLIPFHVIPIQQWCIWPYYLFSYRWLFKYFKFFFHLMVFNEQSPSCSKSLSCFTPDGPGSFPVRSSSIRCEGFDLRAEDRAL